MVRETRRQWPLAKTISLAFACVGFVTLLLIAAGLVWLCFGDDYLAGQEFKRFGFELPPTASGLEVTPRSVAGSSDLHEAAYDIRFQLSPQAAKDFTAHPLPGYNGWQQTGVEADLHNLMINEKRAKTGTLRIVVDMPTGEGFLYK